MPRFEKGSQEAKEYMASLRAKRGMKTGAGPLEDLAKIGNAMGKPFKDTIGVNPFTLGYDIGHDVIAPAIMKGRGKGMKKGGSRGGDTYGELEQRFNSMLGTLHSIKPDPTDIGIGASMLNELRDAKLTPQEVKEASKIVAKIRKPKKKE